MLETAEEELRRLRREKLRRAELVQALGVFLLGAAAATFVLSGMARAHIDIRAWGSWLTYALLMAGGFVELVGRRMRPL